MSTGWALPRVGAFQVLVLSRGPALSFTFLFSQTVELDVLQSQRALYLSIQFDNLFISFF